MTGAYEVNTLHFLNNELNYYSQQIERESQLS